MSDQQQSPQRTSHNTNTQNTPSPPQASHPQIPRHQQVPFQQAPFNFHNPQLQNIPFRPQHTSFPPPLTIPQPVGDSRLILESLGGLQDMFGAMSQRLDGFNTRIGGVEQAQRYPPASTMPVSTSAAVTNVQENSPSSPLARQPESADTPAGITRRRHRPEVTLPHLQRAQTQTAPVTPQGDSSTIPLVQSFRSLPREDKIEFRRILESMGTNTRDFLDDVSASSESPLSAPARTAGLRRHRGRSVSSVASQRSHHNHHTHVGSEARSVAPSQANDAIQVPPAVVSARPLHCKQENIGEYTGKPDELEGFLSRVKDVLRSDPNPAWEPAVVRALSLAMKGEAAIWHQGLSDSDAARMDTIAGWEEQMREHFPVNMLQLRRTARARKWEPTQETANGYYFHKLLLLRQAYGFEQSDSSLVTDIKETLPANFRQMLRMPRDGPTLQDLRREISEWEPTWRELNHIHLRTTATPNITTPRATTTASTSRMTPVTSSTVRSAPVPTLNASGTPSNSTQPAEGPFGLAASYDASRITPAANGRPRTYRRPDTDVIMTLNRPCAKCGGDHFTFEHNYLPAPQVRTMAIDDDDYPEQKEDTLAETGQGYGYALETAPESEHAEGSGTQPSEIPPTSRGSGLAPSVYATVEDETAEDEIVADESKDPHSHSQTSPKLFIAQRTILHTNRYQPINEASPPLTQDTHRFGTVVKLPVLPSTGTGQGFRQHVPLTTHVRINGTDSRCMQSLLDTGASLSVIDAGLLQRLGGTPQGDCMDVQGIGNVRTLGWVTMTVFIDASDPLGNHAHLEFQQDFHVLPSFAPGICLGEDFIAAHDVSISPVRNRGRIGRYTFEVNERLIGPYAKEAELRVVDEVIMAPGEQRWVTIDTLSLAPGVDYTIAPRLSVSPDETVRLAGPTGVLTHAARRQVLLGNYGTASYTLTPGTIIADASAARVGDMISPTSQLFSLDSYPADATLDSPSAPATGPDDIDIAAPLDAFEGVDIPGSGLAVDAATTMLDDKYRVGIDSNGQPPQPIVDLLRKHDAAFALDGRPGRVQGHEMEINLQPGVDLRPEAPRRVGPEKRKAMDAAIDQLLDWDVIEPSTSPVSFPVLMVRQYNKWRFCVDYRQLNTETIPDRYPLPTIDSIFHTLCGKKIFSSLDAIRGYHQLPVRPDDRWKTAFVCHRGLYQYKMVPFGLRNAPSVFQRLMDHILGPLRWNQAVVYIDDTVVATDTFEEHVAALDQLLTSASAVGLKFSPSKCTFAVPSLVLLGRKVSGAGVAIWSERARAVQDLARPTTLQELYHTLGLFGYYRAFIPKFALLAAPLTRLLRGWRYESNDGQTRLVSSDGRAVTASRVPIPWEDDQQRSFDQLKEAIAHPPVLAHPDPSKPYQLYVDACGQGFAAILHQVHIQHAPAPSTTAASPASLNHLIIAQLPTADARARWTTWLQQDRFFAPILRRVQENGGSDADWVLQGGVLVRRSDDHLAIPEGALAALLRVVHDGNGHFGFAKTYLALARHFWRPNLSGAVRAWIKHCKTCQLTKRAPKVGELDISQDPGLPFETISFDLLYPFPRSSAGNDAVLAIWDVFSRMILLTPCHREITAEGIAAIISDRVLRMGWRPRRIVTDSESRVSGAVMTTLARSLGADLTPSPPYHQQANHVERAIQTAQHVLQALCVDSRAHWDRRALPATELAMNSTPSVSTGHRPFDLVFVSHPDVVHAVFDAGEHLGVSAFAERLAAANERLKDAKAAVEVARREQKRSYDAAHAALPSLQEGDFVYVRLKDRPIPGESTDKLASRKIGPFPVAEILSRHRVRLELPQHLDIDSTFSVEQLDAVPSGPDPFQGDRAVTPSLLPDFPSLAPPPVDAIASSSLPAPSPASSDDLSVPRSSRPRTTPHSLRDFHLGTVTPARHPVLEDALKGPIHRPRHIDVNGESLVLVERPVAFLSKLTSPAESRLVAPELELCCLAWAFGKLAHLLEGASVTVITDHAPMERMLRSSGNVTYGPTISRCRALLMPQLPNLTFVYRPGSSHVNADALSRLPPPPSTT
ncbi:hypothetical protein CF326_g872 [Tilletia indica]|nr:hypothetical protein CF326_g872 [Tilletia indica]